MELGGKDVCIICDDADLDLAAKNIIKGGFSYSGQRCTAVKIVSCLFCCLCWPSLSSLCTARWLSACWPFSTSQVTRLAL